MNKQKNSCIISLKNLYSNDSKIVGSGRSNQNNEVEIKFPSKEVVKGIYFNKYKFFSRKH